MSGTYATVPGGYQNAASGLASFAAGYKANAVDDGAFVWADSSGTPISSTTPNQFLVRASGGITLYTNSGATIGAALYLGSGTWNLASNKNLKTNFADVDARSILERVSDLPITTWNYKTQDASIRHIGPMAQDFAAAFNVGENDTTISTVDAQGVALAAIQGLAQENKELKEKNEQERKELTELKERIGQELKERIGQELKELGELKETNQTFATRIAALEAQSPAANGFGWKDFGVGAMIALVAVWAMRRKTT